MPIYKFSVLASLSDSSGKVVNKDILDIHKHCIEKTQKMSVEIYCHEAEVFNPHLFRSDFQSKKSSEVLEVYLFTTDFLNEKELEKSQNEFLKLTNGCFGDNLNLRTEIVPSFREQMCKASTTELLTEIKDLAEKALIDSLNWPFDYLKEKGISEDEFTDPKMKTEYYIIINAVSFLERDNIHFMVKKGRLAYPKDNSLETIVDWMRTINFDTFAYIGI